MLNTTSPYLASQLAQPRRRAAGSIAAALVQARGALLWFFLCASLAAIVAAGFGVLWKQRANTTIERLLAGHDVAVDAASAPAALIEARAAFLLARDRIDDAQPLLDQAALRADDGVHVRMLYNMANARLRAGIAAIGTGNFDKAIPLVALAKSEYRSVLRLEPGDWNAKYNFDIAMRLVRDLPKGEAEDTEKPLKTPEKLWTDLPGVPKGLP